MSTPVKYTNQDMMVIKKLYVQVFKVEGAHTP